MSHRGLRGIVVSLFLVASGLVGTVLTAGHQAAADAEQRATYGIVFRTDLPGLVNFSQFLGQSSTPQTALTTFSPDVVQTIQRWWQDPMSPQITPAAMTAANAAVKTYVLATNAHVYNTTYASFRQSLALIDPQAYVEPMYSQVASPLGYLTVMNMRTSAAPAVAALPGIQSVTQYVGLLQTNLKYSYDATNAHTFYNAYGQNGAGKVIGVIDTGVYPVNQLTIAGSVDVSSGSAVSPSPGPCADHGTFVALSAASNDPLYRGPANGASILDIKVWPTAANSDPSHTTCSQAAPGFRLADAYTVAVDNDVTIVDFSSGIDPKTYPTPDNGTYPTDALIARAGADGIMTFVAAGNNGTETAHWIAPPGGAWEAMTIGAAEHHSSSQASAATPASFTSWEGSGGPPSIHGPAKPEIDAFGATDDTHGLQFYVSFTGGGSGQLSAAGTSFAAPMAAGLAAQLYQHISMPLTYYPLAVRGLFVGGTSILAEPNFQPAGDRSWDLANSAFDPSYPGLIDAYHASRGVVFVGHSIPATFTLTMPASYRDGAYHKLHVVATSHAGSDGVSGSNVVAVAYCNNDQGFVDASGTGLWQTEQAVGVLVHPIPTPTCSVQVSQNGNPGAQVTVDYAVSIVGDLPLN